MPRDERDPADDASARARDETVARPSHVRFIGESYRLLFERNPLPMWVYDVKSLYFLAVNDAAVSEYGYSRSEFLRMTIKDIRPPEEVPGLMKDIARMDSGTESLGIWRHVKRDGTVIDVEVRGNEVDFDGHRARFVLAKDVTERMRADRRLRTEFAVTRALVEGTTFEEAIPRLLRAVCEEARWEYGEAWRTSPDRASLRWTGAWHVEGFPSRALEDAGRAMVVRKGLGIPGTTWATGHPEWPEELTPELEFQRVEPARTLRLRQALAFPITDATHAVLGVMVFFSRTAREPDPTFLDLMADLGDRIGTFLEKERTEAERRRIEERFTKAFHGNPAAAAITRLEDGDIVDVNAMFLSTFEYSRDELIGRASRDLAIWGDPAQRERIIGPARRGDAVRGIEETFRTRSGRLWTALVFVEPMTLADEPTILTTLVDVTSLREAQRKLLESERLASIGRTAAFVAHELNTPLTNIALLAASIRRQTHDPEVLERLDRLDAQRRVAAKIIEEVLSFTHTTRIQHDATDLGDLLRLAAEQADPYRGTHVSLRLDLAPEPVVASVDALKVSQVFVNLIKNALQATERGTVTVSLRRGRDDAIVTVQDTGRGMSAEQREQLFRPFFTTKPRGDGVGLGLAFTKAVLDAHGGRIGVSTEPGQGSTFTVELPLEPASPST